MAARDTVLDAPNSGSATGSSALASRPIELRDGHRRVDPVSSGDR